MDKKTIPTHKKTLHIIIGIYSGVLEEVRIFTKDDKATAFEKQLCKDYGVPFDTDKRQAYYDSDGSHAIHHQITNLE